MRAFTTLLLILSIFISPGLAAAKRTAPAEIKDIQVGGRIYSQKFTRSKTGCKIEISAHDVKSGRELWRKKILEKAFNIHEETDVQEVYLSKLLLKDGMLKAIDEDGGIYMLDPTTGKLRK